MIIKRKWTEEAQDTIETRVTPKQKAEEILSDKLELAWYWREGEYGAKEMTKREQDLVYKQLEKLVDRLNKMLHQ